MSAQIRKRVGALTLESGGEYAVQHAARLVRIVEMIAEGPYDVDAIWLAAHMHDWGTFPQWSREDVNHSVRSRELAEVELRKLKCPAGLMERVLEAIEYHHGGADERCIEAILLRDADALDGLGAMGVLREFASIPTETAGCYTTPSGWGLRGAYERAVMRMENNPRMLRLPKAQEMAREKMREMQSILAAFERESFGAL
jgi:uncharacterized protein